MSIYVTGDIHGRPDRLSSKYFEEQASLTKEDAVVILGDFGLVFEQEVNDLEKLFLDWLDQKNFTTIAVLGNHENYDRIEKLPVTVQFGGPVYVLRPSVFLLQSGYVYTIGGKKCFVFNGASSHDIKDGLLDGNDPEWETKAKALLEEGKQHFRIKGISWWPQEVESDEAVYARGLENLEKIDFAPDFVFTHCASKMIEDQIGYSYHSRLSEYFDEIEKKLPEKTLWLFGHYHADAMISENRICLYEQIVRIS